MTCRHVIRTVGRVVIGDARLILLCDITAAVPARRPNTDTEFRQSLRCYLQTKRDLLPSLYRNASELNFLTIWRDERRPFANCANSPWVEISKAVNYSRHEGTHTHTHQKCHRAARLFKKQEQQERRLAPVSGAEWPRGISYNHIHNWWTAAHHRAQSSVRNRGSLPSSLQAQRLRQWPDYHVTR